MILGIFTILMLGIIWLFSVYIKPLENISKIESLREDGIQLDIQSCKVGEETKPCVRIMKDQCNYSKNNDLCVIDLKIIRIFLMLKENSYLISVLREEKR